jgi:hypothetical protein
VTVAGSGSASLNSTNTSGGAHNTVERSMVVYENLKL